MKENIDRIADEISRITKDSGYLYLQVPTFEKLNRLLENKSQSYKKLEDRTVVFLEGEEKRVPHHYFTEEELLSTFSDYNVLDIHTKEEHYCFTGIKKAALQGS
jgi:hypothetical protein